MDALRDPGDGGTRPGEPIALVDPRPSPALGEWLGRVYPFYLHDLSSFPGCGYRLSAAGAWEPDLLPYWLEQPCCHPWVLTRGDVAIGFAFVGEAPFPSMTPGVRFRLCELFVLRGERRSGVGQAAVRAIVARSPGSFELSVLHENAPALRFWRAVLPEHAGASLRETSTDDGVLFSFST